jgi:hydroxypyruvate isomerase
MKSNTGSNRRRFLKTCSATAAVAAVGASLENRLVAADLAAQDAEKETGKRVNHSVCKWCYKGISLDDLCKAGKQFGLQSVELLQPSDMEVLKKYDMTCAIATSATAKAADGKKVGGIPNSWNRKQYHDVLVEAFEKQLNDAHNVGIKNVICFSGNRGGMDDEEGMKNCAEGLKRLMPLCEKLGLTLTMELLNSKVNHADYMCDHTEWGVGLCELVGSDNFKLLYDIYHMQIMEGDVIATINKHNKYISHYHTGGVPGRAEIDDTQELNYPAIIKAILATGYTGFIGQEFIPKRDDKIASLKQGVTICDV